MKTKLTPYYIDLIYDACLKSFWRKQALAKFLRRCGISESFLATWGPEESKRDFIDRLFLELPKTVCTLPIHEPKRGVKLGDTFG